MLTKRINYWIGFTLLLLIMSFFFYKSIISAIPFEDSLRVIDKLHGLQIQLHRDILRHRNSQLHQYDSINTVLNEIHDTIQSLKISEHADEYPEISEAIVNLKTSLINQEMTAEDFKTHYSILQNSLTYFSRISTEIYGEGSADNRIIPQSVLGKLSTLLLQYTRKPEHETELKLYSMIDRLNRDPAPEVKTLINHSLTVIERLSEVDKIILDFNTLKIENQINGIKSRIGIIQREHEKKALTFNVLLFTCSIWLILYIAFMLITLQRHKNTLAHANEQLNREIAERKRTERSLYQLVENDSNSGVDDYIYNLLKGLCSSLDVECAYIGYLTDNEDELLVAGRYYNGEYISNVRYKLNNTPCEEVAQHGRLVYNRDLEQYFPEWSRNHFNRPQSYIGVRLRDGSKTEKGILAIVHNKPIENSNLAESILTLSAMRATTEVSRQVALQNGIRYQHGLEKIDSWMTKLVFSGFNIDNFLENVCEAANDISGSTAAAFPVLSNDQQEYTISAINGDEAIGLKCNDTPINKKGLFARVMLDQKSILVENIQSNSLAKIDFDGKIEARSAILTPVIIDGKTFGALVVFRKDGGFDDIDEQLISQFSQSIRMAMVNMKLLSDIQSQKERAEITLHSIADAVITTDVSGNIEYMNHVAETLTGHTLQESKNRPIRNVYKIFDYETHEPIHNLVESCLNEGISVSKSMAMLVASDNTEREIENSISPIINTDREIEGVVVVFHDESERRQMENVIRHQATHDSLTGLANRNEFDQRLTEYIYDAINNDGEHALCFLDLDRFKLINDTSGHAAGDELLRQITVLLNTIIRGGDLIGRLGGDEFGVILQSCGLENARKIAEKIVNDLKNFQFTWNNKTFSIGVSVGLVKIDTNSTTSAELIKQADIACHTAKEHGRNSVYVYEQKDSELIRRQEEMDWAGRISQALDSDLFRLYGQPIYPLDGNKHSRIHLEVLVRLEDEYGKLIQPGSFIPAAERYNLMAPIDKHIIKETLSYIAGNETSPAGICYCINLSGNSLNETDLAEYIKDLLVEYNINGRDICFEITETSAITNLFRAKRLISELKEIGCRFSLDDFGSGLSSFGYLKNLPVDYLKIDGAFVRDMVNNQTDYAMVAAINQIGHVMGIQTIAEFVENKKILSKLKELKVDYAQGYGMSRPKPLDKISFEEINAFRIKSDRA